MRQRVVPSLVLLLALALGACEGPTGPEGPAGPEGEPGPGTRVVFSGTTDANGLAIHELPAAAGTLANPPAITCWVSISEDNTYFTQYPCDLVVTQSGTLVVGFVLATVDEEGEPIPFPGIQYRIVVVY